MPGECKCKDGYEGADCSEEVDLCQSDPCQNGAICTVSNQWYRATYVLQWWYSVHKRNQLVHIPHTHARVEGSGQAMAGPTFELKKKI